MLEWTPFLETLSKGRKRGFSDRTVRGFFGDIIHVSVTTSVLLFAWACSVDVPVAVVVS